MTLVKTDSSTNSKELSTPSISLQLIESSASAIPEGLSQPDRDVILNVIAEIRKMMPYLRDISAEERKAMLGMADANRVFAGKVLEVIQQNADFLPRSFDVAKFDRDLSTYDRLNTVLMALTQLRDLVDATTIAIGSEAYEDALTAYRHAKASGQGASLEAMVADMGQRFRRTKKKATKPSETA
ncbi:hypothetical protein [Leptolyngbya sp. FACHB-17]|uniref:hypothetical protein n=1 Tax=unclassified Leptolyngbya TaxID=2650499 RepID=UPI0018EFB3BC|nr:hypothetical protein [Leptolyngbya sp. FACHB-17]